MEKFDEKEKKTVYDKDFYDSHINFSYRTLSEYDISPGIRCKFNTMLRRLGRKKFYNALDVGCSGNSFIHFIDLWFVLIFYWQT